jgi:hypothetical protein
VTPAYRAISAFSAFNEDKYSINHFSGLYNNNNNAVDCGDSCA